ncbi:hypothetical protein ACRJ4W_39215 [Streptomyces sp. GLT-R25]
MTSIAVRLGRLFETQRVVFWHDPAGEHTASFEALDLPGVEVVRVQNNEFALKHRFLREEPETKFLVYRSGQIPETTGNWLLDQELAWGVFSADKATLLRQDLGLDGEDVDEVLAAHEAFFADETLVAAPQASPGEGRRAPAGAGQDECGPAGGEGPQPAGANPQAAGRACFG